MPNYDSQPNLGSHSHHDNITEVINTLIVYNIFMDNNLTDHDNDGRSAERLSK